MIRAVIDTNVLVSGLLSPLGNEALIILAVHQGYVFPCFSEDILQENAAVRGGLRSNSVAARLAETEIRAG